MGNTDFRVLIETFLNKSHIKSELQEVQKIVRQNTVGITPELQTASLKNQLKKVSVEIANDFNKTFSTALTGTDIFKGYENQAKQIIKENQLVQRSFTDLRKNAYQSINNRDPVFDKMAQHYREEENAIQVLLASKKKLAEQNAVKGSKIDYSIEVGDDTAKIDQLEHKVKLWGDEVQRVKLNLDGVKNAYSALETSKTDEEKIANAKELQKQYDIVGNKLKQLAATDISPEKRLQLSNQMETWLQKNSNAAKLCGDDVRRLSEECKTCDSLRFNGIKSEFDSFTNQARIAGKLGNSLIGTFKNAISKFAGWGIASSAVMTVVSSVRQAYTELKEVDTILTEISKTSDRSVTSLTALGESAVQTANKYGATISGYLKGVQEMSRAGFGDAQSEELAELSSLSQSAGDMTADLANDYLISSDAAYGYKGNVEKLNALLDGQNQVTNRNAVSMEELANATKVAANQLSNMGIAENELTALLGTGIATSRESGETVGRAVKGIFMNLQQVKGETGFDGEIIDEEELKKVEARCHSVGVELEFMKDGIARLRDPMEVLKELSEVYNALPKDSADRAGIISDIGGKYRGNVLSSLLTNYDKYEKMLSDYENSEGSALSEALKTADSWQGLLNQISNNWTGFVQNFAEDSTVTNVLKFVNGLVSGMDSLVETTGALVPLLGGAGVFAFVKNLDCRKVLKIA